MTGLVYLISSISMVDPLSRESPDILSGENTDIDSLCCLVVTVAVIPASRGLASSVLNLSPPPSEEPVAVVIVSEVLLPVLFLVLAVRVQRALPVPGLVEVDGVDGEEAHVVQAGALRDDFRNISF